MYRSPIEIYYGNMRTHIMEEIAEKSGFSKTTVRKRLEIAKLDPTTLKKVSSRFNR